MKAKQSRKSTLSAKDLDTRKNPVGGMLSHKKK
jgi:hypothetical protein